MVLENLDLIELLQMSFTNEYYHRLCADVFRRKTKNRKVVFRILTYYKDKQLGIRLSEPENSIYIENCDLMLKFLKSFGNSINTLKMDYSCSFDADRRKEITEWVNKYCAETLLQLELVQYTGFKLDYFTLPFKTLQKLSIDHLMLETKTTTLYEKFPALRDLTLKYIF